jgi:hypothetical protein
VQGTHVFNYGHLRIGVIGIELKETPELVSAGATAGLQFLDEVTTIKAESEKCAGRASNPDRTDHQGTAVGQTRGWHAAVPWADRLTISGHSRYHGCMVLAAHASRLELDGRQDPGG